jgi:hypothetical protein
MAPKTAKGGQRLGSSNDNFARSAYQTIMSPDNRSVVTAIGMFTVRRDRDWNPILRTIPTASQDGSYLYRNVADTTIR